MLYKKWHGEAAINATLRKHDVLDVTEDSPQKRIFLGSYIRTCPYGSESITGIVVLRTLNPEKLKEKTLRWIPAIAIRGTHTQKKKIYVIIFLNL